MSNGRVCFNQSPPEANSQGGIANDRDKGREKEDVPAINLDVLSLLAYASPKINAAERLVQSTVLRLILFVIGRSKYTTLILSCARFR
ncbi:hypothetical protein GB937_004390 [Aspergillus fischeri]|nr:hypothetical protein GB937_004390 [Aspergillus fischeri]